VEAVGPDTVNVLD